jgi:hypothetical protein
MYGEAGTTLLPFPEVTSATRRIRGNVVYNPFYPPKLSTGRKSVFQPYARKLNGLLVVSELVRKSENVG